jgi:hypothetical protein
MGLTVSKRIPLIYSSGKKNIMAEYKAECKRTIKRKSTFEKIKSRKFLTPNSTRVYRKW